MKINWPEIVQRYRNFQACLIMARQAITNRSDVFAIVLFSTAQSVYNEFPQEVKDEIDFYANIQ